MEYLISGQQNFIPTRCSGHVTIGGCSTDGGQTINICNGCLQVEPPQPPPCTQCLNNCPCLFAVGTPTR